MSLRYPTTDAELKQIVRGDTSYDDTPDELPDSQLDTIVEQAKGKLQLTTGVSDGAWYTDDGLGYALAAYTKMRAKAAAENIGLAGYRLGAEDVTFHHADPDTNFQLQMWAEDVNDGLDNADTATKSSNLQPADSAGYIGESYYRDRGGLR